MSPRSKHFTPGLEQARLQHITCLTPTSCKGFTKKSQPAQPETACAIAMTSVWEEIEEEEEAALHGGQYQAIMHDTWHEGMTVTQGAAPHRINLQSGFLRQIVRILILLMFCPPRSCMLITKKYVIS